MPSNLLRYGVFDAIESLKPGALSRNIFRTDIQPLFPEWDESKDGLRTANAPWTITVKK